MKPWFKSYKAWVAIVGALTQLAIVLVTVFCADPEHIATLITAGTAAVLTIVGVVIFGHTATDVAYQKRMGAEAIAAAMEANGGPVDPSDSGHA